MIEELQPKLYDLTKLKEMSRGNEAFVQKMIGIFADRIPSSLESLNAAYVAKDYKKIRDIVHLLKPGIDNMGIIRLKENIRAAERLAAEQPENERLYQHIKCIEQVLLIVHEQLKEERK